ncbi:hypothetical protein LPY66_04085 [Dehalobacter sp. DCM]|uniref:hypothetical protein n=1 Tax=Dehalobacter sp. DCM TaxID=2907827 RepID=UPI003081FD2D|nr:hypothetical protein LPY66_04085 [Dehalobacter sp. DCM]
MTTIGANLIPGNNERFGQKAERTFIIRPQCQLAKGKPYKLIISKLLQANNYKYL